MKNGPTLVLDLYITNFAAAGWQHSSMFKFKEITKIVLHN